MVGNFGIAAQIDATDGLEARLKINPPHLGQWLQNFGVAKLWIESSGPSPRHLELRLLTQSATYPEYRAKFDAEGQLVGEVRIFAPLGLDSSLGFYPALIAEVTVQASAAWQGKIGCTLTPVDPAKSATETLALAHGVGLVSGCAFLAATAQAGGNPEAIAGPGTLTASLPVVLTSAGEQAVSFTLGSFDDNGRYAEICPNPASLLRKLTAEHQAVRAQFEDFVASFPRTGDEQIDRYVRWYASAGILLTKGLRTGEVLTMGYRELNQRDSFWSSGIHLVFWPDLDRKMIEETAAAQLPDGRIPVTILPLINRQDEIDSTEYFILRVARHYRWHRNDRMLAQVWPAVKKGIAYLDSRDPENIGLPRQRSYWADWKDIPGVQGRTYAPHFALLWLATLQAGADLAEVMRDATALSGFRAAYAKADSFINRPFVEGGMWQKTHYADRWADGRTPSYVLQDQLVGAYFDVIPKDRLSSIYHELQASETAYGVRETFPYAPYSSGYRYEDIPGNYHNGGIWPWLNFMDVKGRYAHGHPAAAERIIRKVGYADLEAGGDYQPGEFMNDDTGRNLGFSVQAWDAALFSAIYFGAFGLDRVSPTELQIRVRVPSTRDFSTRLVLPGLNGILASEAGKLFWRRTLPAPLVPTPLSIKLVDERVPGDHSEIKTSGDSIPSQVATGTGHQLRKLSDDWPNLARYREENAQLAAPLPGRPRIVFMGDSITEGWLRNVPEFFRGRTYLDRGVGGQTTPQMLLRFRQDVVDLKPAGVVILGGTNDLAGNTGPASLEMIENNLRSMCELARANGVVPVLASLLPCADYYWNPGTDPAPRIIALNRWIAGYAHAHGIVYLDYYSAMANEHNGLRGTLSPDGVHPNRAGYEVMAPLAEKAISKALPR